MVFPSPSMQGIGTTSNQNFKLVLLLVNSPLKKNDNNKKRQTGLKDSKPRELDI